jgi:UDP-N-acetylglucosamine 4,6-dehydratase/5-epimerase
MSEPLFTWHNKSVLVTGGTGSFGRKFVEVMLPHKPKRLIVFSRDELKQHEMRQVFNDAGDSPMRYFIGDVRDRERLRRAFHNVEVVIHAAALKQVPACEYNPIEAVQTNIDGARNVVDAAIDAGVQRLVALSSDKAVGPVNLYGATKLVSEKLFVQANSYSGADGCRFSCVRYGNVVGSRGSVIPLFRQQRETGQITVTDPRMTRFWITLDQGVRFVIRCAEQAQGGEVFVPKIPSMKISDLARVVAPGCDVRVTGIRPGEKLHELLISEDEARNAIELEDMFVIEPLFPWWTNQRWNDGKRPVQGFRYGSDTNSHWLTDDELRTMASV